MYSSFQDFCGQNMVLYVADPKHPVLTRPNGDREQRTFKIEIPRKACKIWIKAGTAADIDDITVVYQLKDSVEDHTIRVINNTVTRFESRFNNHEEVWKKYVVPIMDAAATVVGSAIGGS